MTRSIAVEAPVTATVGPVYLRLFPYEAVQTAVDDFDERPWAWGALVTITFRIGELVTSKKVRQRYAWHDKLGWARRERPSDEELAIGRSAVLTNLREQVRRHGFEPPEFEVIEVQPPAAPEASDG